MSTRPVALIAVAIVPLTFVACSKQNTPEPATDSQESSAQDSHAHDNSNDTPHDETTEATTMPSDSLEADDGNDSNIESTPEAFGQLITKALIDGDIDTIIANIKTVNLPDDWQQMVIPMFTDLKGRNLEGKIRPRSDFSNEDLSWPDQTPEPYTAIEHILHITYESGPESGTNTFPLILDNGQWKILLAQ